MLSLIRMRVRRAGPVSHPGPARKGNHARESLDGYIVWSRWGTETEILDQEMRHEEVAMRCFVVSPCDVVCSKPVRRHLEDQHGDGQAVAKALRVFAQQWDVRLRKLRSQNQHKGRRPGPGC